MWAKSAVISDLPHDTERHADLVEDLSHVISFDDGHLPLRLKRLKSYRSMLLNALLAHELYEAIFRNLFF